MPWNHIDFERCPKKTKKKLRNQMLKQIQKYDMAKLTPNIASANYYFSLRAQRLSNHEMTNDNLNLSTNISLLLPNLGFFMFNFHCGYFEWEAAWLRYTLYISDATTVRLLYILRRKTVFGLYDETKNNNNNTTTIMFKHNKSIQCRSIGRWRYLLSNR